MNEQKVQVRIMREVEGETPEAGTVVEVNPATARDWVRRGLALVCCRGPARGGRPECAMRPPVVPRGRGPCG